MEYYWVLRISHGKDWKGRARFQVSRRHRTREEARGVGVRSVVHCIYLVGFQQFPPYAGRFFPCEIGWFEEQYRGWPSSPSLQRLGPGEDRYTCYSWGLYGKVEWCGKSPLRGHVDLQQFVTEPRRSRVSDYRLTRNTCSPTFTLELWGLVSPKPCCGTGLYCHLVVRSQLTWLW